MGIFAFLAGMAVPLTWQAPTFFSRCMAWVWIVAALLLYAQTK